MEQYLSVRPAAAADDTPAELSEPIELDSDDENNSNDDAYAAFKDIDNIKAIRVEDEGDFQGCKSINEVSILN